MKKFGSKISSINKSSQQHDMILATYAKLSDIQITELHWSWRDRRLLAITYYNAFIV